MSKRKRKNKNLAFSCKKDDRVQVLRDPFSLTITIEFSPEKLNKLSEDKVEKFDRMFKELRKLFKQ